MRSRGPLSGQCGLRLDVGRGAALDTRIFSALGRLPSHSNVVGSTLMPPGHSADAMVRADIEAALSPQDSREMHPKLPEGSTLPDRREVLMIMSGIRGTVPVKHAGRRRARPVRDVDRIKPPGRWALSHDGVIAGTRELDHVEAIAERIGHICHPAVFATLNLAIE